MKRSSFIILSAVVTLSSSAWADQEDKEIAIANMLSPLGNAVRWNGPTKGWGGGGDEIKEVRDRCREALADAKKAGVKPGDKITAWKGFETNPKAKVVGEKVVFTFADAAWYCDDLDKRTVHWDLVLRLSDGKKLEARVKAGLTDTEKKDIAPELVEYTVDIAARCKAGLQAELAAGATEIEVDGAKIKLADAGAICDTIVAWGELQKAAWEERKKVVGAKYAAVGIKGDRLELFIYYDDLEGWYLPGCKKSTMEPKALKAQKALFQWLTDSNDVITIRKFSFKGDKYKITEKQYLTEGAAYRGCR